jgi:adhesin transport system membrane fusion protein
MLKPVKYTLRLSVLFHRHRRWFSGVFIAIIALLLLTPIFSNAIRTTARVLSPRAIPITLFTDHTLLKTLLVQEGQTIQQNQPLAITSDARVARVYHQGQQEYLELLATISRLQAESRGDTRIIFPKEIKNIPAIVARETAIFNNHHQQQDLNQQQLQKNLALAEEQTETLHTLLSQPQDPELNNALEQLKKSFSDEKEKLKHLANVSLKGKTKTLTDIATILNSEKPYIRETTITSPINGIVKNILIKTSNTPLEAGRTLLTITPWTPNLLLATRLSPKHIQHFHEGEKLSVRVKSKLSTLTTNGVIARIQSENMFIQIPQTSSRNEKTLAPDEIVTLTIKHQK